MRAFRRASYDAGRLQAGVDTLMAERAFGDRAGGEPGAALLFKRSETGVTE